MYDLQHAIEFAVQAHKGQYRKGGLVSGLTAVNKMPYIVHPMNVMRLLMDEGCNEDLAMAGVLHDVIEDAGISATDISKIFGLRVAQLVVGASEPDKSLPWKERKDHTITVLTYTADVELCLLTCADKIDNLSSTLRNKERYGDQVWDKFKAGKHEQWWYYDAVAAAVRDKVLGTSLYRNLLQLIGMVF